MTSYDIRWVGDAPTDSIGRLAAFAQDGTNIGEATYKRWERDPDLKYIGNIFVDDGYRRQGVAQALLGAIFARFPAEQQYVVSIAGNLGRLLMESVAGGEGAPRIFELQEHDEYKPMN